MNPSRLLLLVVVGCLLCRPSLWADEPVSPLGSSPQFSADMIITTSDGKAIDQKVFKDNDKMRTEMTSNGTQIISIIRPDQKKAYSIMVAQKMIMVMPYDAEKYKEMMMGSTGPQGKFEVVGPDTVDGVACTKYKVTTADGKIFYYWIDTSAKAPVKMAADDGSMSIVWKNYKTGPQDAALFEPPTGYQVMSMPSMPGAPTDK